MEIINNLLTSTSGPTITFEPPPGRRASRRIAGVDTLIVRRIEARNPHLTHGFVDSSGVPLAHLMVGRDASEIVQRVPFSRRAGTTESFNRRAITIALINPGSLEMPALHRDLFERMNAAAPGEYLSAFAEFDNRFRWWATYPQAQLDLLVEISLTLIDHYGLTSVRAYDQVLPRSLNPGPSFPRYLYFEVLKGARPNIDVELRVLEKAAEELRLRHRPVEGAPFISQETIAAEAAVVNVGEQPGWSLVEVVPAERSEAEIVAGRAVRWLKGWAKSASIKIGDAVPVVRDQLLTTEDGRKYTFIQAHPKNFDNRPGSNRPKYLLMHFTTGTQINQAINTFTNEAEGTSIHLIIGRDGRVIQMVPFDRRAFHAGLSFWEKQSGLNAFSIGIELDNAGQLSRTRDGQHWQRKGVIIPDERTAAARHPKDFSARQWERFPQQQVDAAFAIAKALVAAFGLEDIIGHDQVNFLNRYDPGPLFEPHMRDFRQAIYGRPEPKTDGFRAAPPIGADRIDFYVNREGRKPRLNHPIVQGAGATKGKLVNVLEKKDPWWRIKLKSGTRAEGWTDKTNIRELTEVAKIDRDNAVLFKVLTGRDAGPPPTIHPDGKLPAGALMRLEMVSGEMALVVAKVGSEPVVRDVEGWVRCVDIEGIQADRART